MDRIGGLDWFFPRANIIPEAGGPIRCYSDNQIDTVFQAVDCDYRLTTNVNDPEAEIRVAVFPNPVHGILTVETDKPLARLELIDLRGKTLKTSDLPFMDFGQLSNGLYILRVHLQSGESLEKKIIKSAM